MDDHERKELLLRVQDVFGTTIVKLIEHLVAQVKHNIPEAERRTLYDRFLTAIASIIRIEELELNDEAREHLERLIKVQRRQIADLEQLRDYVTILERKGDFSIERRISDAQRDFIYSLKREIDELHATGR